MEQTLAQHAHEVAAVIVEPLVQCAGNMRMYHPAYLKLLRRACDEHQVLLIADEIAVGFGRTGTLFACEQAAIRPDLMCLSKGLTAISSSRVLNRPARSSTCLRASRARSSTRWLMAASISRSRPRSIGGMQKRSVATSG